MDGDYYHQGNIFIADDGSIGFRGEITVGWSLEKLDTMLLNGWICEICMTFESDHPYIEINYANGDYYIRNKFFIKHLYKTLKRKNKDTPEHAFWTGIKGNEDIHLTNNTSVIKIVKNLLYKNTAMELFNGFDIRITKAYLPAYSKIRNEKIKLLRGKI